MVKKLTPPSNDQEEDAWLVTYADAITLLLAFFVTTTAITQIDIDSDEAAGQIAQALGRKTVQNPVAQLESRIQQITNNLNIASDVPVGRPKSGGMAFSIPSDRLFVPGTAVLTQQAATLLTDIQDLILDPNYQTYSVQINAHASSQTQPQVGQPPSRWDMTADQASAIARFFIWANAGPNADGSPDNPHAQMLERFEAVGYADTRPVSLNMLKVIYRDEQQLAYDNLGDDRVTVRIRPSSALRELAEQRAASEQG